MPDRKDFYRKKYKDSLFVIKAGGRIITDDESRKSLLSNIQELVSFGIKVLLVFGGGTAIDDALENAGIETRKANGRRITGKKEIEIIKQVMSANLGYRIASSMAEIRMSGLVLNSIPTGWCDIRFRDRDNIDDYGFDGTITELHSYEIRHHFDEVLFMACPCIGVSHKNAVNINADDVAVAFASGLAARKLIFLSDTDGVIVDGKTASYLTDEDIPQLIEERKVTDGMRVKMENCLRALQSRVNRIHLVNGFKKNALLDEIYNTKGASASTMIILERDRERYEAELKEDEEAMAAMIKKANTK